MEAGKRTAEDLKEWRELNQRWWQFGTFSPLMRSHGEGVKREIHEISPEGSPMRANLLWFLELRYRLMPYIYTAAADSHFEAPHHARPGARLPRRRTGPHDCRPIPVRQVHPGGPGDGLWRDLA